MRELTVDDLYYLLGKKQVEIENLRSVVEAQAVRIRELSPKAEDVEEPQPSGE